MKKIVFITICIYLVSVAYAAGPQGVHEPGTGTPRSSATQAGQGTGQGNKVNQEAQNAGEDQNLTIQQQAAQGRGQQANQETGEGRGQQTGQQLRQNASQGQQLRVHALENVEERIHQRERELNQELQNLGEKQKNVYQNQNRVRLAVHSLLAMENLTGGIGPRVSQIAREFNNSVRSTIKSEEKIQNRRGLSRFLFGGDEKAAEEITSQVIQNQRRIQQLKQLQQQGNLGEKVKSLMTKQIQAMEQEQNRLQEKVQQEKNSKGLFGWLWK